MRVKKFATKKVYKKKPLASKSLTKVVSTIAKKAIEKKVEHKKVCHIIDEQALLTSVNQYNLVNLYQLSQGTASTQRVGNQISPTGVSFKGHLSYNSTTSTTTCYVRMALIESKEVFTALTSEVFKDTATNSSWGALSTSQMATIWTPINNGLFRVHWQKIYKLNPIGSGDGGYTRLINEFIPLKGVINYDANATGAGNQSRNFCIAFFSAEAAQDTVGQTIEVSALVRTYFNDM